MYWIIEHRHGVFSYVGSLSYMDLPLLLVLAYLGWGAIKRKHYYICVLHTSRTLVITPDNIVPGDCNRL